MNKLLGILCATVCTFAFAALVSGTEATSQNCQQVLDNSCTKCHGVKRICKTMDKADADWPVIVADMGKRGKLSREVQDQALSCVTSTDAALKSALCPKK